jgi:hypothetical protein
VIRKLKLLPLASEAFLALLRARLELRSFSPDKLPTVQPGRRGGHAALYIRMPVSDRDEAHTALQQIPASIHSAIAYPFVARGHCTGMLTAVPEIQATLT